MSVLLQYLAGGKDPSHVNNLQEDFAGRLNQMLAASEGRITINSGYRSEERQAELFAAAIQKYGSEAAARKWVAPPGKSNHNFGLAADLGYSGDGEQWAHKNAANFGLHFRMSHEPWHIEMLNGQPTAVGDATGLPLDAAGAPSGRGPPPPPGSFAEALSGRGAPPPPASFAEALFGRQSGGNAQTATPMQAAPRPTLPGNMVGQDPSKMAALLEQLQAATSKANIFG